MTAPHRALTMLVHGPSKSGKSLMAASLPKPLLYMDVESASRFLPLRSIVWDPYDPPPEQSEDWDTCVVHIRQWTDATQTLSWLQAGLHPFKGVSVDSISELQYRNLEHVSQRAQMKIQDWGTVLRELGGFVRDLRDLTMHPTNPLSAVFITAMTQEVDGIMRPYLQGQMKTQIPYLLDVTGYLWVDEGTQSRKLLTRRMMGKEAGERVNGRIPAILNLPDITGATREEIGAKNRTFQMILKRVFAEGPVMAKPEPVAEETPPPPPTDGDGAPQMSTAAAALAAEQAGE